MPSWSCMLIIERSYFAPYGKGEKKIWAIVCVNGLLHNTAKIKCKNMQGVNSTDKYNQTFSKLEKTDCAT